MGRKIARIMRSRNSTRNVIKLCEQRKGGGVEAVL
jgi:hypothetical protein